MAFTYEVRWVETDTPFDRRFEKYLDYSFFEHKVRGRLWGVVGGSAGDAAIVHRWWWWVDWW